MNTTGLIMIIINGVCLIWIEFLISRSSTDGYHLLHSHLQSLVLDWTRHNYWTFGPCILGIAGCRSCHTMMPSWTLVHWPWMTLVLKHRHRVDLMVKMKSMPKRLMMRRREEGGSDECTGKSKSDWKLIVEELEENLDLAWRCSSFGGIYYIGGRLRRKQGNDKQSNEEVKRHPLGFFHFKVLMVAKLKNRKLELLFSLAVKKKVESEKARDLDKPAWSHQVLSSLCPRVSFRKYWTGMATEDLSPIILRTQWNGTKILLHYHIFMYQKHA